ncbi:tetratricopeptide repeat protein [Methylicorpusculum sp.]|uniref:tetratricopeptide repeat protein n=1 Tax=Methylicorpusculum sp. TaxID=2713644 RepID=UPI00271DF598|nr:tetratricopeptide repeat protein [Methylicorpusculum sp.]MDO8845533.1 tetratricopeptide repeat protein [Methylicorpusculum sp.]
MIKIINLMVCVFVLSCITLAHAEEAVPKIPIKESAEQGNALAQAQLGALFLLGRDGYEVNVQEAAVWMLKAAEQGLLEAEVIVAAMYDRGLGMPQDVKKATQWYEKAAAKGHGASLAILGKNEAAKGSVAFNYQAVRLKAATQIPNEYAKKILLKTK